MHFSKAEDTLRFQLFLEVDSQQLVNIWTPKTINTEIANKDWSLEVVPIGQERQEFRLFFKAEVNDKLDGDSMTRVAIDEFMFVDCEIKTYEDVACPQFKCKNNKCVDWMATCDGQDDCDDNSDESDRASCDPDLQCTFDDWCDFEFGEGPRPQAETFAIAKGAENLYDGPTRDHTDNIKYGSFALVKVDDENPDEAVVRTLIHKNPTTECATFYIANRGENNLRVNDQLIKIENEGLGRWQQIRIADYGDTITIVITVSGAGSYLAIDDFVFNKKCPKDFPPEFVTEASESSTLQTIPPKVINKNTKGTAAPSGETSPPTVNKNTKKPRPKPTKSSLGEVAPSTYRPGQIHPVAVVLLVIGALGLIGVSGFVTYTKVPWVRTQLRFFPFAKQDGETVPLETELQETTFYDENSE